MTMKPDDDDRTPEEQWEALRAALADFSNEMTQSMWSDIVKYRWYIAAFYAGILIWRWQVWAVSL